MDDAAVEDDGRRWYARAATATETTSKPAKKIDGTRRPVVRAGLS
jgi:hypothetical protein